MFTPSKTYCSRSSYLPYSYFGDGREKSIAASGDAHGGATSTYDANNVRIRINQGKGDGQSSEQIKEMVVDSKRPAAPPTLIHSNAADSPGIFGVSVKTPARCYSGSSHCL